MKGKLESLNTCLFFNIEILLLGIYPKKMYETQVLILCTY